MKYAIACFGLLLTVGAVLVGCGGGGGTQVFPGEVSGVVFDSEGYVVRGARVYNSANSSTTTSTTTGTYSLYNIPAQDVLVRADITKDGVRYYGQNLATVLEDERVKNVNITLIPESQLASFRGTVRNSFGSRLRGVRVFLRPANGNTILSSAVGLTDSDGQFSIGGLMAATPYTVQVNGLGYNSSFETVTLSAGSNPSRTYNIPDGEEVNVPAPNMTALTAFTSPAGTRSANEQNAIEALKQRLSPGRAKHVTRTTVRGNPIEVDLFWDEISSTGLLGYGIYRGRSESGIRNIGFLRDPQAVFFADNDDTVVEDTTYYYALTSLDTLYDGQFGESDPSQAFSIVPLSDLVLGNVSPTTTPTIRWSSVAGATSYGVYLFTQYPGIGVEELSFQSGITGTEYTYSGSPLTSGRTYYYMVYAERPTRQSFGTDVFSYAYSFSNVGQFTVR